MDHVLVDIDPDIEDTYTGTVGTSYGMPSIPVPIEAKLRTLAVKLLYEVCRTQKFSLPDLRTSTITVFLASLLIFNQEYLAICLLTNYSILLNKRETCRMIPSIIRLSS
jgi:hypothetical protein